MLFEIFKGNGYESDLMGDERVYILDVYNEDIYPHDHSVKSAIRNNVPLSSFTTDGEYLRKLKK